MKYSLVRERLRTGDVLLFDGKGPISAVIKRFTFSKWSHVGMVVYLEEFDLIACLESTTLSDVNDVLTGKAHRGVQIVPLSERLSRYDGSVAVRMLEADDDLTDRSPNWRRSQLQHDLRSFRREVHGRPYEGSVIELVKSAYDGWGGSNAEDLSSLFCSELLAEAYQRLGVLPEPPDGQPSNEYTPNDFACPGAIQFRAPWSLGETIPLENGW